MTVVNSGLALNERVGNQQSIPAAAGAHIRDNAAGRTRPRTGCGGQGALQGNMSISEPFVRRPIATSLLMGGIFLIGLVVFPLLPVAPLPQESTSRTIPRHPPRRFRARARETMASSVATPLEYQFAEISRACRRWTSTNVLGTTQITLQFDLNRNIDAAAQDVQTGIDAASGQLPKKPARRRRPTGRSTPQIRRFSSSRCTPTCSRSPPSTTTPENILAQQISQIPGIAQVSIGGQQKPAVRVQIDPTKLAALGLQMEDVANVITAATVDAPKGSINAPSAV